MRGCCKTERISCRRNLLAFALLLLVGLTCQTVAEPAPRGSVPTASVHELKAAFVFHFMKYVEWPEEMRPARGEPLVLGVLGEQTMHEAVDRFAAESVGGHPLQIKHFEAGQELESCHVLFVGSSKRQATKRVLSAIQGSSTLTVSDTTGFIGIGGMIELKVVENRVGFEVDLLPSNDAGLKLSSKLLRLALRVENAERVRSD